VITFYDFGVAGPTTDVVFAVQDFDTGTSTGAQSFTSATITGVTPKAALVIGALHQTANDPGETAGMSLTVGMVDATAGMRSRAHSRDNTASTNVSSRIDTTLAFQMRDVNGTDFKSATGTTTSGGIALNFTQNNSPDCRALFAAFAGADTSGKVGSRALGTGTAAQDINTVGFEPDVVIFVMAGQNAGVSSTPMHINFGMAVNNGGGSVTQRSVMWNETTALADSRPFQAIRTDCAVGELSSTDGSVAYKVVASDFDASGFSLTCSASAGADTVIYTALKFTGRQFNLVDVTTPTSTGSFTITGAGFTPRFALLVLTNLETVDDHPGSTDDKQSGFSVCCIGSDEQWSASWRINAAEATTDTASQVSNVAIMGASATDCDAIKGTFTAWTSDGVTLNLSATQGTAKKGFILFVE
jgi:hypothetical protein